MKRFLLLVILFATQYCVASPYPVITSVEANPLVGQYFIKQAVIDIGPAGDVIPAAGSGYVALLYREKNTETQGWIDSILAQSGGQQAADGVRTASQLAMASYNNGGGNYTQFYYSRNPNDICIGYGLAPKNSYQPWSSVTLYAGCTLVPPSNQWCKITTPELLLDHGTITLRQSEENSTSQQMTVDCTTDMAVRFDLVTSDKYVYLQPTGKAEIKVNDMPVGSQISLNKGLNQVKVSDSLSGLHTEGSYIGSSVLVMMPY